MEIDIFEGLHDQRKIAMNKIVETGINQEIYDDSPIDDLVDSIKEHGLLTPIKVIANADKTFTLISGHRRLMALKELFTEDDLLIPAQFVSKPQSEYGITELIVEHNRYRIKTKEELIKEGMALEQVINEKAGRRMIEGEDISGYTTRDVVGEHLGMSGKSYAEGKKVVERIEDIEKSDPELAAKARETLKSSIHGASKVLAGEKPAAERKAELESEYAYWPALNSLIKKLYQTHESLKTFRNHTTGEPFANLVGNIVDFAELMETWKPETVKEHGPGWNKASKK